MDALDGNAIGGLLQEVFGREMTDTMGRCATCGLIAPVAETVVYLQAPGIVVRCRTCTSVMMVFVKRAAMNCVDMSGVAALESARV